jgi:Arf-GAP/coiled-coil/ANK repeat/PH domain-containing protein
LLSKTNGKVSFSDSYDLDGVDRLSLGGDNDADQPGDRHDEHSKGGYLWKRSTSLNRNWQRRWFFIKEGKMYYVHAEGKEKGSQLICDLLISTVKLDVEPNLMYTFEIISPGQRRYVLQAESEEERDEWVRSLRSEIELSLISSTPAASATTAAGSSSALRQSVFGSGIGTERISLIKAKNSYCADCGAENPEWVSLNLNILICIECSGIHRSLGTHISKVRSLTLDALYDHNIDLLDSLGNEIGRLIWEARLTEEEENNVGITSCL